MTIMLIAHPRKTNGRMPTSEDLKDSQSIHADADQVIFLYRKPILDDTTEDGDQTVLDPKTKVRVDAARFGAGGNAWIYFQGETATFVDLEDRPVAQY